MPEAQAATAAADTKKGPVQDPAHGAHVRHPIEADRHARAAEFHKSNGDEAEHARSKNLERWTRERHVHNQKAAAFVDLLGLTHEVTAPQYDRVTGKLVKPGTVTYNDGLNYVAKTLHEKEHAAQGSVEAGKSVFARSHQHLKDVKGTLLDEDGKVINPEQLHVSPDLLNAPRDYAAEVVEHLGLTEQAHISAAKALFAS